MASTINVETPMGIFSILVEQGAVTKVMLADPGRHLPYEEIDPLDGELPARAASQLVEILSGHQPEKPVPVRLSGTPFQVSVWNQLRKLPVGSTITYTQLAEAAGHPKASRAVGSAMAANPVPVFVPCHRVLSVNGLGGFAGGLALKRAMLSGEGVEISEDGQRSSAT
ncbi:MAG: methylated-DNA--[protein]-cysteine S-methyltransferase [Actinomycetes bacterium]